MPCGPAKRGSVGVLGPGWEARLVKTDWEIPEGIDAAEGESGELVVRGPCVMMGYIDNEEATEGSFTPRGWFKTGDEVRAPTKWSANEAQDG